MIGKGKPSVESVTKDDILNIVREEDILMHYFNIESIPCLINSPFRQDEHPSFSIFTFQGKIFWKDYATNETGDVFSLLMKLWSCSFATCIKRIYDDLDCAVDKVGVTKSRGSTICKSESKLDVKVRKWNKYDKEYWDEYGISIKTLKWADVYPISHIFITRDGNTRTIVADKLAYVYIERKEGNITKKVYQPKNKLNLKWISKHDHSVISLWEKMINFASNKLCICSSVKDALCLFDNTGIPSIAPQGEGYKISKTAQNVLKSKFENIYILFDNDEPGCRCGMKLAKETGFKYIELPYFDEGKDISDLYKCVNDKNVFKTIITELFV